LAELLRREKQEKRRKPEKGVELKEGTMQHA
jgi:hypothetical protein